MPSSTALNTALPTALPPNSLILVTGASGHIAGHVVHEALLAGYRVRGTARSAAKTAHTQTTYARFGDAYTTTVVSDFALPHAFDEAVRGVDAIIHVASDTTFGTDPNVVVTGVVNGVESLLTAAAAEPSVKRFVLTSSSMAAYTPHANVAKQVTADSWNSEAVDAAWAPPPYTPERAFMVYGASKVEGERALWKFVQDHKPHFVANAVLPNFNMGKVLDSTGATGAAVPKLLSGEIFQVAAPQYAIDVIDDARLHVIAAVLDASLTNERIFAFGHAFRWTDLVALVQELRPHATGLATPPANEGYELTKVPNEPGAELLRKWYGQETGYKPFRQTVEENLEGY